MHHMLITLEGQTKDLLVTRTCQPLATAKSWVNHPNAANDSAVRGTTSYLNSTPLRKVRKHVG